MMSVEAGVALMNPWWTDPQARGAHRFQKQREAFARVWNGLNSTPSSALRAQVLVGPKQVGKTTVALQSIDKALDDAFPPSRVIFVDFASGYFDVPPTIEQALGVWPTDEPTSQPRLIVLDEISQAPHWARSLKSLIDESRRKRPLDRILVTDSAARLLREGAIEYLQGRIDEHLITGLLYAEFLDLHRRPNEDERGLRARINALEVYLSLGGFPAHFASREFDAVRERVRNDTDLAIYRDLARTGIDIDASGARRLFRYLAIDSGAIFNAAKRSAEMSAEGERGPDPRSIQSWVSALAHACLLAEVPPYLGAKRPRTAATHLRARPKLYAADHAFVTAMNPIRAPMESESVRPKVIETAVCTHLRAFAHRRSARLSYLREERPSGDSGSVGEVDFVLEFDARTIAIEVKAGTRIKQSADRRAFATRHGIDDVLLVHGGVQSTSNQFGRSVGLDEFLSNVEQCVGGPP